MTDDADTRGQAGIPATADVDHNAVIRRGAGARHVPDVGEGATVGRLCSVGRHRIVDASDLALVAGLPGRSGRWAKRAYGRLVAECDRVLVSLRTRGIRRDGRPPVGTVTATLATIRRVFRAGVRWVAHDETRFSAGRSALVLAPHPDDETLGCGATILRKVAAGTPVTVAVLTDGRYSHRSAHLTPGELAALRKVEMTEAATRLGLAPGSLRWGDFVDGTLGDCEDEIATYIQELILKLRPDDVYATSAVEPHPDHAALGRAARRAAASVCDPPRLLEYPVWLLGSSPLRRGDRRGSTVETVGTILGRRAIKVGVDGHRAGKLHALRAHASQLGRPVGVPADEEWEVLPPWVLDAAADSAELFLPWTAPAS